MRVICLPACGIAFYLLRASNSDFLMPNIWMREPETAQAIQIFLDISSQLVWLIESSENRKKEKENTNIRSSSTNGSTIR